MVKLTKYKDGFEKVCLSIEFQKIKDERLDKQSEEKYNNKLKNAEKKLHSKYGDDWKLISFTGTMKPCLLEHKCGETKRITRFNNAIRNNLKCECEKKNKTFI